MSEDNIDFFNENTTHRFTVKEYLYKYLSYWPLFIVCLITCVGIGFLYTHYTEPKYEASTLILVKGKDKSASTNASNASNDLIESALNGKSNVNLDNEIQLMRSSSLMERVVSRNGFNISYYKLGKVRTIDMYLDAPIRLIPQYLTDSNSLVLTLSDLTAWGGMIKYGPEKKTKRIPFMWNQPMWLEGKRFTLMPKGQASYINGNYLIKWNSVKEAAAGISSNFSVVMLDSKTTIVQLKLLSENLKRGVDILNAISKEYNLSDIEDRNNVAQGSIRFIDERLAVISKELSGVEGNLENFQGSNKLINVEMQSSQSFENSNDVSKSLTDINIQQGVVQMILNYLSNPATSNKLVPSTLGLNDATLSSLIAKFNELQLTKQREAPLVAVNSTVIADLNHQINDVRSSILEALQNITRNLKLQEVKLQQQNFEYRQFLTSLPRKERAIQEIKRKQSITEGLYMYLLQKREEAAIGSTSSSTSNYKQIDPAKGYGPVEPNTKNIRIYSALLGLLIPIGLIYLKDLLNDKITSKSDITSKIQLPLIGEISHIDKRNTAFIAVMNGDVIAEQFRLIRTNFSFLMKKKDKQIILVTSTASNEGKSLISTHLAAVLVIPDKKVALLEFDLRRPTITKSLGVKNTKGITHYLSGQTKVLCDIYQEIEGIPNLHFYPSGPIPPIPGDLLLNENLKEFFNVLKKQYDYIIVDTAPLGIVSDAFVLGQYSDAVIYIVRQQITLKREMDFLNEITSAGKLQNIGLIFNDVADTRKYGSNFKYSYNDEKKTGFWNRVKQSDIQRV